MPVNSTTRGAAGLGLHGLGNFEFWSACAD